MHDSLEIEKKDNGYSVDVMSQHDDEYDLEELVFQDPLDVLAEVLRFLGYDEDTRDAVTEMLDEDVAYVLTDKGHETLAQLERGQTEKERLEHERAERDWERQRLEAEIAVLKRGSGRGLLERGTRDYWHTTGTGTDKGAPSWD